MMRLTTLAGTFLLAVATAGAQDLTADQKGRIDAAIQQVVDKTGVPSASVGVVQGGRIVYTRAFGDARLKPELKATAAMSYPVGSISKQFTAVCLLLLAEDGKLKLDDPVSRFYPELTRAKDVTIRELLSHTSGYEDYAPQDYTIPAWMNPTDPAKLVREWAGKPLDFEPGTQWQYSNTNFVLAALIVEKASGMGYFDFLRSRILKPLGISALNLDTERDRVEPLGYERHALAPLRTAVLEAPGWYYGDASLAMPVGELLKWDLSIINRTLLKPASYDAFETAVPLKDGKSTRYGLGISVFTQNGRRVLEHSGEVGGFVAENMILPDQHVAIAVLTNQEASSAAGKIASAVGKILMVPAEATSAVAKPQEKQVQAILTGLQNGTVDRQQFTPDANFYFSADTLEDFSTSLKPLGTVAAVVQRSESLRGGMFARQFGVTFAGGDTVTVSTYTMKDGKLEQFLVEGGD
jgi:D-alanyl-D-alanine carboxypeptidase